MDPRIARCYRELSGYVHKLKDMIRQEFPEAQFGRLQRYMDPDCTGNRRDDVSWEFPVYTFARDMASVFNLVDDRVTELFLENDVHILVMPYHLSEYESARKGLYALV